MNKLLLLVAMLAVGAGALAACGSTEPAGCQGTSECGDGFSCVYGECVRPDAGGDDCTNGDTRQCGQTSTVGACKRGTQTCVNGVWAIACVGEVNPVTETCNQKDDDCDGQTDEGVATSWYPDNDGDGYASASSTPVQACTAPQGHVQTTGDCDDANTSISPSATEACGTAVDDDCDGTVNENCACATPGSTVQCCGGRGTQTCGNDGVLTACSASISAETCNGQDDNCNGTVDEGTTICGAGGEVCTAGTCACGGGQVLCGGVCATPATEVCDGVDNDCDGSIDETLTVTCRADADGDRYVDGPATSEQCPVGSRPDFGLCPVGYVAPASSLGVDCNAGDAALYRLVSSRTDFDADGRCDGAAQDDCVGTAALPGRRFTNTCEADDCNDANAQAWEFVALRADADNDGYCMGANQLTCASSSWVPAGMKRLAECAATDDCSDSNPQATGLFILRDDADGDGYCVNNTLTCAGASWAPAGKKFAAQCQATDDCNDSSSTTFVSGAWAPDADGDGYCTGAPPPPGGCIGNTPPSGYRNAATCTAWGDCAASDASKWRTVSLRADADNDSWCSGLASNVCIGTNPPAGQRYANTCAGEDCSETNAYANATCLIMEGYGTSSHTQTCPSANMPVPFDVTALAWCPPGFNTVNHRVVKTGNGYCYYQSPTQVTQQCNLFDGSTCRIVADCQAL